MNRKKEQESEEIYNKIKDLFLAGEKDKEIAGQVGLSINRVIQIRTQILHLSLYDIKKKCAHCGKEKAAVCFSRKETGKYKDWCISCRRSAGIFPTYQRGKKKKDEEQKKGVLVAGKTVVAVCLKCGKRFVSEIIDKKGNCYRTCSRCRRINTAIVSMELMEETTIILSKDDE